MTRARRTQCPPRPPITHRRHEKQPDASLFLCRQCYRTRHLPVRRQRLLIVRTSNRPGLEKQHLLRPMRRPGRRNRIRQHRRSLQPPRGRAVPGTMPGQLRQEGLNTGITPRHNNTVNPAGMTSESIVVLPRRPRPVMHPPPGPELAARPQCPPLPRFMGTGRQRQASSHILATRQAGPASTKTAPARMRAGIGPSCPPRLAAPVKVPILITIFEGYLAIRPMSASRPAAPMLPAHLPGLCLQVPTISLLPKGTIKAPEAQARERNCPLARPPLPPT